MTLPDNLDYVQHLDWSPNGSYLAFIAPKKDQMWRYALGYIFDIQNNKIIRIYPDLKDETLQKGIVDVRWGRDSSTVAALSGFGYIYIFDPLTDKTLKAIDLGSQATKGFYPTFDWSSDNSLFAAPSGTTSSIGIWNRDGKPISGYEKVSKKQVSQINCSQLNFLSDLVDVKWSNDGQKLAISTDHTLTICNLTSDFTISEKAYELDYTPYSMIWTLDGHWLMTTYPNSPDCRVRIYDVTHDYKLSQEFELPSPPEWKPNLEGDCVGANKLALSPSGEQVAAMSSGYLWIGAISSS